MVKTNKIRKLGTSSSKVNKLKGIFTKKHLLNSVSELNAIIRGIEILAEKLPETIEYPISIKKENNSKNNSFSITYKQRELKPWIKAEWITGEQLFQVGLTIIKQQAVLFEKGLCLIDARPENYWLAKSHGVLIDLGSIKPLTKKNLLSYETDFKNNFTNPLILEAELNLPVSQYFKGKINSTNINLWGINRNLVSISFMKDALKNNFINFISNLISSSSPEFIEFLNLESDSQKEVNISIKKSRGIVKKMKKKFNLLKPKIKNQSNWNNYENFHDKEYNSKKLREIKKFVDINKSFSKIVDLGSNLTTKSIEHIDIRIDNDLLTSRKMRQIYNTDKIILQIDIADCICYSEDKKFNPLNCGGEAKVAVITGLIHHLIIDYGLSIDAFYEKIAYLYRYVLLEFPSPDDPMVQLLIRKKNETINWDWNKMHLPLIKKFFQVQKKTNLSPTRDIFQLKNIQFD